MPNSSQDTRPGLALIANCITPYRVNLHQLIAAGIPELRLHTLITHDDADFKWSVELPEAIHVCHFGRRGDSPTAATFRSPLWEWNKGTRLIHYLKHSNVRAVICTNYRYVSYLRAIRYCYRAGIPVFVRSDSNIECERHLSRLKRLVKPRVYAWLLRHVDGVMPMGDLGDRFFLKYGADPRRMYRVPYTPDYDAYTTVDLARLQEFRDRFGLSPQRRYFSYCGRLVAKKRVDLLIDAFARLAADRPEWDLLIVGDGTLREELRQRVPEQIRSRVVWTGFLERDDLIRSYRAADVLVLPSDKEPWALVVQEAMAAGLAVVASDVVGAARDLITDGTSGRIFAAGNIESLQQAMTDVTAAGRLDAYKEQSKASLRAWRERTDPVAEIRRALLDAGVLTEPARQVHTLKTSTLYPHE